MFSLISRKPVVRLRLLLAKFPYKFNKYVLADSGNLDRFHQRTKNLMTLSGFEFQNWWQGASGNWAAAAGYVVWASGLTMTPLEWATAWGTLYQTTTVISTCPWDVIQAPPTGKRPHLHATCQNIISPHVLVSWDSCCFWCSIEPQSGCLVSETKQIQPLTVTPDAHNPSSSISTLSHTLSCPSMFRAVASD